MTNMKFTQLSTSEFKLDSVGDFCINSFDNCIVLLGNSSDINIFELMNSCDTLVLMPYSNKQISVMQDKPVSEIIREVDLVKIYEGGNVQESQELALDVIYAAECSMEPLKARVLQTDIITINNTKYVCVLTNYGHCELFQKAPIIEEWKPLGTNLSKILITDVFSSKVSPTHITTLNDLKTYVNKYIITCFVMTVVSSDLIIYLGTAAGYIVGVKYNPTSCKFAECCHLKTALSRICYITMYKHFILIGCDQGRVRLVKINFENNCLQELDYLWSKPDRMACRKAILTYNEEMESYLVVFCKAAHILAYRLNSEGVVLYSSTIYVSGIKISGIESISSNKFIITTITGAIKLIKIVPACKEEINVDEEVIEHDFDSSNYQILGIAASSSKNLWSFLLYRNKDYVHQSKYSSTTAFLNVCKLNTHDSFIKLINMNLKNMNSAQDLVMAINLNIFNNQETERYINYLDLNKLNFPQELNDAFLQKLQIKLIIVRKLAAYQNIKYRKIKAQTQSELQILEPFLQLLHILSRLRYLKQLHNKAIKLSKFQELSIVCMQLQLKHLLNDFIASNSKEEENMLQQAGDKMSLFVVDEFEKYKFETDTEFSKQIEYCMICNQAIISFLKCQQDHEIKRCTVSSTQLTLFKTKYCPHCFALARNDEAANLQELYSAEECITCIYCKFLFKQDDF
ncbi:uncharacterized protein ACRADG_002509 [Cochliomyia hominivorax]